ncbi:SDR family oxidoreductase [Nocardia australiensis]|uniref:SDR family oxidoreductase n=1 Tax=Nocardia australiensis TaxID=2887191 RepID=UPI001D14A8AA|nr:SDR family oxidoreductase [Nocardia australiensis]
MSNILLTGGTGTLGSHVTPLLLEAGHRVRILSRSARDGVAGIEYVTGDLLKDEAVAEAVAGVDTIVHLAGGPKGDEVATRNLVRAAAGAGTSHFVHISVIAADAIPVGYYRSRIGAERAVIESGVPHTILRAAQFHDLILTVARAMSKMPIIPAPKTVRFQPVDSREVAARLVELADGGPVGLVADLAGPTVYAMPELLRGYLRAAGKSRPLVSLRVPGKIGKAYRSGANLNLGADTGKRTWEDFLVEQLG